ncbi:hypothetical protein BXY85_0041 [Roseivirga pacifica]|uniref:Chitin-binding type-2 domain-containing protein n=1 Tax=Roseivirga pacifica TaxID=1267423 RepID=A0A1I0R5D9_9BACT|nr:hypothetical protein BXY85_0041 [Roseivirga pacifica]SEW35726.1 hypothetical protein SAMN05216290_3094 [Roseivirga pacifica]
MKKKFFLSLTLLFFISVSAFATRWSVHGTHSYGDCTITYEICETAFLSTDGCTENDVRAIYDPSNSDCQTIIENGALFL